MLTLGGCGDRVLAGGASDQSGPTGAATTADVSSPPAEGRPGGSDDTASSAPGTATAGTVVDQATLDAAEATLDDADRILDALDQELAEDEG